MSDPESPSTNPPTPLANRLLACLRARRTYLMIYEAYRRAASKQDLADLLDVLIEDTQDLIASISSLVRRLDLRPLMAGVNETLLDQGKSRRGTPSKLNFIVVGSTRSLQWYAEQQVVDDPPEARELWRLLIETESRHLRQVKEMLGLVEVTAANKQEPPPADQVPTSDQGGKTNDGDP